MAGDGAQRIDNAEALFSIVYMLTLAAELVAVARRANPPPLLRMRI